MDDMSTGAAAEPVDLDAEPDSLDAPAGGAAEAEEGQPDNPPADSGPNAEAAKYRRRLREAETKLAVADARADMLTRREIERLAADRLADGTEIWNDGTDAAQLLGDDGMPSAEAVAARVAELLEAHPHWQRVNLKRLTPPASSVSGNVTAIHSGPPGASWSDVLTGRG